MNKILTDVVDPYFIINDKEQILSEEKSNVHEMTPATKPPATSASTHISSSSGDFISSMKKRKEATKSIAADTDDDTTLSSILHNKKKSRTSGTMRQMLLTGNRVDDKSPAKMDTALAVLTHSLGLPLDLASDPLMVQVLNVARTLPESYSPPSRFRLSGELLNSVYEHNYKENLLSLTNQAQRFGLTIFGDGATIVKSPLVNILASGVNNPSAMMDIVDCTHHCAKGYKKDAKFLASEFMPVIETIQGSVDTHGMKCRKCVQLITFDGAFNFQKAAKILTQTYPWMTVIHEVEHAVSLFFSDIFEKVMVYRVMSTIAKKIRDVFCSTRHVTGSMFKEKSIELNKRYVGCIQPSECR